MSGYGRRNQRSPHVSPVVVSLLIQILSQLEKLPYKPPVTLGLLAMNIIAHIHPDPYFLDYSLTNVRQNCIWPSLIVSSLTNNHSILWNRIVLAGFMHADDMHLYYNMLSLLWKGVQLEQQFGSFQFGILVVYSLLASHILLVVMSYVVYAVTQNIHISSYDSCAIGFSAVLFSLKYVLNQNSPAYTSILGFQVPSKWAAWAELVLASLLSPQVSFIGHLAGILAGYLYVHMDSVAR
ncbi:rhomboid family intramembrane serine protease, partial [archaeon]